MTNPENEKLKDINKREWALLLPITILVFWIGIYPKPIISRMDVSVNHLLTQVDEKYKITLKRLGKEETGYVSSDNESSDNMTGIERMEVLHLTR